jgi:hypothetical protein
VLDFPFESALQLPSRDFNETFGKVDRLVGRNSAARLNGIGQRHSSTPTRSQTLTSGRAKCRSQSRRMPEMRPHSASNSS